MADLDQIIADLNYAADEGAQRLKREVIADAESTAQLGRPGPGLRSLASTAGGGDEQVQASQLPVPALAARMAEQAADGGARLAVGKR